MDHFAGIIHKLGNKGMALGGVFLTAVMLLIVTGIVLRILGGVLVGSYELVEVMIVLVVATSLGYTALEQGHVTVKIIVSRFPQRFQGITEIVNSIIGICFWGGIVFASIWLIISRWLDEETEALSVPVLPFRFVWVAGLIFLCLVLMVGLTKGINKVMRK